MILIGAFSGLGSCLVCYEQMAIFMTVVNEESNVEEIDYIINSVNCVSLHIVTVWQNQVTL